ncbi:MAG: ATP-grasp domain-containing protein, partial [Methermicoccaceae archaeon]
MNPLKLLVVEYATSTGLAEFIPEGLSMLATLVNDFMGCGCEVSYLSNEYILRAGRRVPSSKDNFEQVLERELQYVDGALLIAPDDLMVHLSKLLDDAEAVNLGCPSSSVMGCADKLRTWKVLKSADIPTPNPWDGDGFVICKPRMGCGAKGVKVCTEPIVGEGMDEEDWTYWEFSEGEAYSVGCVLSDDTSRAISLTHQLIEFESADGERYAPPSVREALKRERTLDVNYLGNVVPAHHPLIEEAIRLSLKA